jgi:hypothetical protein
MTKVGRQKKSEKVTRSQTKAKTGEMSKMGSKKTAKIANSQNPEILKIRNTKKEVQMPSKLYIRARK